jgi:hypothetical protein
VKTSKSHPEAGPRKIKIKLDADHNETVELLQTSFFPNGKSFLGKISKFECSLGKYNGQTVPREDFSIDSFLQGTTYRIYLHTREKLQLFEISDSTSDSSDELPDLVPTKRRRTGANSCVSKGYCVTMFLLRHIRSTFIHYH